MWRFTYCILLFWAEVSGLLCTAIKEAAAVVFAADVSDPAVCASPVFSADVSDPAASLIAAPLLTGAPDPAALSRYSCSGKTVTN